MANFSPDGHNDSKEKPSVLEQKDDNQENTSQLGCDHYKRKCALVVKFITQISYV